MTQAEILHIMQQAIYTVIITGAPMLIIGMAVGLLISVFQATTQIHEQTLTFVPKLLAIFVALLVFGGFIMTTFKEFWEAIFAYMNSLSTLR